MEKELDAFSKDRGTPRAVCKSCVREYNREYYKKNSEKLKQYQENYRFEHGDRRRRQQAEYRERNRDALSEWHKKRRRADPEAAKARDRQRYANRDKEARQARDAAYYRENADLIKKRTADWQRRNPERRRLYAAARRARKMDTQITFTADQLESKLAYWSHKCWVCRGPGVAIDHVKPLSRGGGHVLSNMRPICTSCNSRKRNRWPLPDSYAFLHYPR